MRRPVAAMTDVLPVYQADCLGVLTCYVTIGKHSALTVIDTAFGLSLINKSFVVKHGLVTFARKSPSIAPIQGTSFVIDTACNVPVSLFNIVIHETCGVLESFLFDLLLGLPYLRKTPFLIDCKHGKLFNPTNQQSASLCLITMPASARVSQLTIQGPKMSLESTEISDHGGSDRMTTREAMAPGVAMHVAEYQAEIGEEDDYMVSYPPYDISNVSLIDEVDPETWTTLSIGPSLTNDQKHELITLLKTYSTCFPTAKVPIGKCNVYQHHIDTGTHRPVQQALRRFGFAQREEITKQIKIMLANEVIEPCVEIEWSSNLHLVVKKDGTFRMCVDFRDLNNITVKDLYPMVRIDDCLDSLKQTSMYTGLDLVSGYWQIQCDPSSQPKTAFVTPDGHFYFKVMPFGLCNAPATFCRIMDKVLQGLKMKICLVYLDDIQVYANDFKEHLNRLAQVLQRLQEANLKIKPSKCNFCQDKLLSLATWSVLKVSNRTQTKLKQ